MTTNRTESTLAIAVSMVLTLVFPGWVSAATCDVPSMPHPTIQSAVDDATCTPIVVAAGTFVGLVVIDRTLTLTGGGSDQSFIQGGVEVQGGTATITGFHITGPNDPVWAHSGGEISAFDLDVIVGDVSLPSIFVDGFESGNAGAWSTIVP